MRTLKTSEAASVLHVSPNTLRSWERRFGYPMPARTAGHHRLYTAGEVLALRDALREGLSIASAISRAREAVAGDTGALAGALGALDLRRADAAMEASLALRTLERTLDVVLLPALDELGERHGEDSAPYAVAAQWGVDWLRRARRFAAPAPPGRRVLVGAAIGDRAGRDQIALAALELLIVRAGADVTSVPVDRLAGLSDLVDRVGPRAVLVAGSSASDDRVGRWMHRVRAVAGAVPVMVFRRGDRDGRAAVHVLDDAPLAAAEDVTRRVLGRFARLRAEPPLVEGDVGGGLAS